MTDSPILCAADDPVATITLNRPTKRNAIDLPMIEALFAALDAIEGERRVRVVLLRAAGETFCAGGDIKAWSALNPQDFAHLWIRRGHRVFDRLAQFRKPTIAVISGPALGGGLELAAACDFRIAERQARFGLPESGLGMVPGWSGTQRLARRFGIQTVRRMALGGLTLNADEAWQAGIVDAVVDKGEGGSAAIELADSISSRGPAAVEVVKTMLAVAEGEAPEAAVDVLAGGMVASTPDLAEGVAAFAEKRRPSFD